MYVLTFAANTAGYRCHAVGCKMAVSMQRTNVHLIPETFDTIEAARAWSDADESEKAGEPVQSSFRVCDCAKISQ